MDQSLKQLYLQIAELRWRAEYTYKIQYTQAEKYHKRNNILNIIAIIATSISTAIATISGSLQIFGVEASCVTFVSAGLSLVGTIFISCNKNLSYGEKIQKNIEVGANIKRIYIDYECLLTDIKANTCDYQNAVKRRDEILDRETKISEIAPLTFAEAVDGAEEKLEKRGDNKCSEDKIMRTLPDYLRL